MITAEQMMSAHKTNVENFFGLTGIAFEGIEKMIELNVQTAKTAMAEAAEATQAALAMKDPQQMLASRASMMQPAAEKAARLLPPPVRHRHQHPAPKSARSPRPPRPMRKPSSSPWSTTRSRTPRPAPRTRLPW